MLRINVLEYSMFPLCLHVLSVSLLVTILYVIIMEKEKCLAFNLIETLSNNNIKGINTL